MLMVTERGMSSELPLLWERLGDSGGKQVGQLGHPQTSGPKQCP